jgi:hypothetical protein
MRLCIGHALGGFSGLNDFQHCMRSLMQAWRLNQLLFEWKLEKGLLDLFAQRFSPFGCPCPSLWQSFVQLRFFNQSRKPCIVLL